MSLVPRPDTTLPPLQQPGTAGQSSKSPAAAASNVFRVFFFFFFFLPQPGLISPCALFLLCFCNEKFGRSHLFSGSFAQAVVGWGVRGGARLMFFLVYK